MILRTPIRKVRQGGIFRDVFSRGFYSNDRSWTWCYGIDTYGSAVYKKEYKGARVQNGLHSAGHDVFDKSIAKKYPESYDPAVPYELVFSG